MQKRYYPQDKKGNFDEWAAQLANQHEAATLLDAAQRKHKRDLLTNEYGKSEYLKFMQHKVEEGQINYQEKSNDRRQADIDFDSFQRDERDLRHQFKKT